MQTDFKCSECGYIHNFMHLYGEPTADYTFCPNCGADMRTTNLETAGDYADADTMMRGDNNENS